MSNKSNRTDNELITKRRRKKRIRNSFLLLIFLLAVLFILSMKLPYFNIKNIRVYGNKSIKDSNIIALSKIQKGDNIFYVNMSTSRKNILKNPYIDSVSISMTLPSIININVTERSAVFYIDYGNKFYIIDKNGILLQKRNNISNMNLVKLSGIIVGNTKIGNKIKNSNSRKFDAVTSIGNLIGNNVTSFGISTVDVSDPLNIKAYRNNIYIKLGDADNMRSKLNKALNIIKQENLNNAKGYVDVRFQGNPVYYIDDK